MNYQEKVSTRADVKALYERVIANPAIERYRGFTETKSYGWNPLCNDYIKREGEVFFENPAYVQPCEACEPEREIDAELEPLCEEEIFEQEKGEQMPVCEESDAPAEAQADIVQSCKVTVI